MASFASKALFGLPGMFGLLGKDPAGRANSFLFGRGARAVVPPDVQRLRQQNIDLLTSLLNPGAFGQGGVGRDFFFGGADPNAKTPEMSTFETLRPLLESMMTGTGAQFEGDIARANQTGGRFSSGNAIMRSQALGHLFDQRGQTAQTLGLLAGGAGTAQRGQQSQLLQLLVGLLGMSGQASLSLPVENDKGAFGDALSAFAALFGGGKA